MRLKPIFLLCLSLILNCSLFAQTYYQTWAQDGSDIDGESNGNLSGRSVSLSSDGSTVAIGAYLNNVGGKIDVGHVRVYKNVNGTFTQVGSDINGEASLDRYGWSVSLSSDGSTVAIGADHNDGNGTNAGHVRVYKNVNGRWTQVGSDIDGEAAGDRSGWSVSLSSDGSTLAIGAPWNGRAGHVRVYNNVAGTWTQVGSDIDGVVTTNTSLSFSGWSVSLSSDGSFVAIGDYAYPSSRNGRVKIYENISGTWTQVGSSIDGEGSLDNSGYSVSLSSDGSIVAIGAPANYAGAGIGHVRVYKNLNGIWTQVGSDIDGEAVGDRSGESVSLSSDGNTVAIGAFGNDATGDNAGHARVYKNVNNTWTQVGSDIDGEAAGDESGIALSLSSDGSIVAIGAPWNAGSASGSGHVRVYSLCDAVAISDTITACGSYTWTDGVTYTASNTIAKDSFVRASGCDSIISLNLTILSTSSSTDTITSCGSYTWTNGITYTQSDSTANDTLMNLAGCDSVITLHLTINNATTISQQPIDLRIPLSKDAEFSITTVQTSGLTLQWQTDLGTGFQTISNAGQYSGAQSMKLIVSSITTANDNQKFRCIVSDNDCSDTSDIVTLTINTANINDILDNQLFHIYPNPAKDVIHIDVKSNFIGSTYSIISVSGQKVSEGKIEKEDTVINIQDLVEGVYFIQLGENIKQSFKILKQ